MHGQYAQTEATCCSPLPPEVLGGSSECKDKSTHGFRFDNVMLYISISTVKVFDLSYVVFIIYDST